MYETEAKKGQGLRILIDGHDDYRLGYSERCLIVKSSITERSVLLLLVDDYYQGEVDGGGGLALAADDDIRAR